MNKNYDLYLYEEIMLLALRDEEGTISPSVSYHFALGGALLAELLLRNIIKIEYKKKAKFIVLANDKLTGDALLDECIEKLRSAKRKARIETWVSRFSSLKNIKHRAAQQLCNRGILKADEDTVLLLFKRKIYPELNPEPEQKIIERLRSAVFNDTDDMDPRTIVVISIAKNVNLLKSFLSKDEQKSNKKRIEQIVNGEITGKATKEAIEALQAAVMVACIMPAIAASTVSS